MLTILLMSSFITHLAMCATHTHCRQDGANTRNAQHVDAVRLQAHASEAADGRAGSPGWLNAICGLVARSRGKGRGGLVHSRRDDDALPAYPGWWGDSGGDGVIQQLHER